eukprot:COSAG03_NODE_8344_length_811_cov_1.230337_1_plen_77_part_01
MSGSFGQGHRPPLSAKDLKNQNIPAPDPARAVTHRECYHTGRVQCDNTHKSLLVLLSLFPILYVCSIGSAVAVPMTP